MRIINMLAKVSPYWICVTAMALTTGSIEIGREASSISTSPTNPSNILNIATWLLGAGWLFLAFVSGVQVSRLGEVVRRVGEIEENGSPAVRVMEEKLDHTINEIAKVATSIGRLTDAISSGSIFKNCPYFGSAAGVNRHK